MPMAKEKAATRLSCLHRQLAMHNFNPAQGASTKFSETGLHWIKKHIGTARLGTQL